MEKNKQHEKELLLHMLFGTIIFLVLATAAVGLDLVAQWAVGIGVSQFTHQALSWTAHAFLVVDLLLFASYTAKTSWLLIKELLS
jgi:hypothetical protein